jgi:pimeloyl-ACP methyl ester carboxylesterase
MTTVQQGIQCITTNRGRVVDLLVEGLGEPILWLHSGFRGREGILGLFKKTNREMNRMNREALNLLPNMTGFGDSSQGVKAGANPYEMAEDIIELIQELNLRNVKIVGYSLGANVAAILANQVPDYIQNLVLLATAIEGSDLEVYRSLLELYYAENWEGIISLIAQQLVGDKNRPGYLRMMPLAKKQVTSERFKNDLIRIIGAEKRLDVFDELEKNDLPTLMISGKQDPFVPRPERIEQLSKKGNIQIHLLEGIGHNEVVFPRQVDISGYMFGFWGF